MCVQDTIEVVQPYPYSITDDIIDIENVPFAVWLYAHPQLFFKSHTPTGWLSPKNPSYAWVAWLCGLDFDEEENSENWPSQAFCRNS